MSPADLPSVVAAPANRHYERLGGRPAVARLVAAFYRAMDERADARVIRAMHDADLAPTRAVLVSYLSEWMGGPREYSAQRGAPMLRRRHHPFDIDTAARDAWMACMRQALDETCEDADLKAQLDAAFLKIADVIRNTEGAGERRPHPGKPRAVAPDTPPLPPVSSATGRP